MNNGPLLAVGLLFALLLLFPCGMSADAQVPPLPLLQPSWEATTVGAKVGGSVAPDGTEIQIDLPGELHLRNKGGRDGAGLCVFTSINHSAYWQNVRVLQKFRDWMTKHPGGGYPSKVDKMIAQICKEEGVPVPDYIQVEGSDLEPLRLACKTGRTPGVTYCFSPSGRYGGQRIAHMVSLVHLDDKWAGILDNNYPGADKIEWLTIEEFKKTYMGGGGGWGVILLNPGPPPVPRNS
jgi:hypothetical protein